MNLLIRENAVDDAQARAADDDFSVRLQRDSVNRARAADTVSEISRIERRIDRTVRVEPDDSASRHAVNMIKRAADQKLPVRLFPDNINRTRIGARCRSIKRRVDFARRESRQHPEKKR